MQAQLEKKRTVPERSACSGIEQAQYLRQIVADANAALCQFLRTVCIAQVDAGVTCPGILLRHPPEGQLDDAGCVEAHAQLQK